MHSSLIALALAASVLTFAAASASAQDTGTTYVVTYIEVAPAAADRTRALLQNLRTASVRDDGQLRFEMLQSIFRPQHFAILEVWKDAKAQEAHAAAPHTRAFREALKPLLNAPYDERPHGGLFVGASQPATGRAIYAVTHVDFIPPKKDDGIVAVEALFRLSAKDPGNLRYDVLQQSSRPNHLTLVEVWRNRRALEAHESAAHTKAFREALLPMSGSLYDQRLYKSIGR
jgi:quinol monooxygenase YgiN